MSDPKKEFAAAVADARTEGQDQREATAKREHEERLEFVKAQQRMAAQAQLATLCIQNPIVAELVKERDALKAQLSALTQQAEEEETEPATDTGAKRRSRKSAE